MLFNDINNRMDGWGAEGKINPFQDIYGLVFHVTVRMASYDKPYIRSPTFSSSPAKCQANIYQNVNVTDQRIGKMCVWMRRRTCTTFWL